MAFISSGYNPAKPMEGRISDIGPRKYNEFFPPVIARNFGKWLYQEILEPGVLVHVAESGETCYTVRIGGTRTMSITHIRELTAELGALVGSGKLRPRESIAQGLAAAPEAFLGLLKGKNFGKQLVKLV